jgi:hypothetical protein
MRWLPSFVATSLLALVALAAKKSSADRFNEFHSSALSSSPIKLLDSSYKSLTSSPRDYTVAVLLTALENRFGCQLCREFQPEWELLSRSWIRGDKQGQSRLLFGTLDFSDGRDTFMSVSVIIPSTASLPLAYSLTHCYSFYSFSLACRQHLSYSFSNLQPARMPYKNKSQCDMTLQMGENPPPPSASFSFVQATAPCD